MAKRFKIRLNNGKTYRFTGEQMSVAWNIMDRTDKKETASLYLEKYLKFDMKDFTDDEWWLCVATLCKIYTEKYNGGANDAIWKSACDEFKDLWEKGDII